MWWNKHFSVGLLLIVSLITVFWFSAPDLPAQGIPEKVIEAEGVAAVTGEGPDALLRARDEATKRALRQALEQGIGTLVDSESMAQNFQLLNDEIYSQVKGYVKEYEVINDNNGKDKIYRITVRATVVMAQLEKDLKALNIIKKEKGFPRVMVLFREVVDETDKFFGGEIQGSVAQTEMEKIFLQKGFQLVDKSQLNAIQQRDVDMSYADPAKAAALGRRFGAEVIIVGESSADLVDSSRPYGVSVFYYQGQIAAKAINVDTATIIAVDNVQSDWRKPGEGQGSGRMEAARQALQAAGKRLAENMMTQILERWRSEVFNTVSIQIIAENVTGPRRKAFKNELKSIRGVESVNEREFANGILSLDVEVEGSIWKDFDERVENFTTVGVEITGKTANRIDLKLSDLPQASQPPVQEPPQQPQSTQ